MIFLPGSSTKIAISVQLTYNGGAGGVESVLVGLVAALGKLEDGPEEYVIVGPWDDPDWLKPYLGPNQHLVRGPKSNEEQRPFSRVPSWSRPLVRRVHRLLNYYLALPSDGLQVPLSNGYYEGLGCEVIHFPHQDFVLCAMPSIYNPHDLQHLHFPQFFTPTTMRMRECIYRAGCHYARVVVTASQWVKNDLVDQYGLSPKKIQVIPWGAPTQAIAEPGPAFINTVKSTLDLPSSFAFYPAMLCEHKNHLRLLEALAYLRDQKGVIVHLVCTGYLFPTVWPKVEQRVQELGLDCQVRFLGMVSPEQLRAIYRLSTFVIVPTLFEAASGPVFEAWHEGVPVACSGVTSLPEQVGDAALLFDPYSVEAIANATLSLAADGGLREELMLKGRRRLVDFSWERTAKAYRAVYRLAARRPLTEEDRWLLSWDWMRNPECTNERIV